MQIIMEGNGLDIDSDRVFTGLFIKASEAELVSLGKRLGAYMYRDIDIVFTEAKQPQGEEA